MPIVLKNGSLKLLESLGPVQACNETALVTAFLEGTLSTHFKFGHESLTTLINFSMTQDPTLPWGGFVSALSTRTWPLATTRRSVDVFTQVPQV